MIHPNTNYCCWSLFRILNVSWRWLTHISEWDHMGICWQRLCPFSPLAANARAASHEQSGNATKLTHQGGVVPKHPTLRFVAWIHSWYHCKSNSSVCDPPASSRTLKLGFVCWMIPFEMMLSFRSSSIRSSSISTLGYHHLLSAWGLKTNKSGASKGKTLYRPLCKIQEPVQSKGVHPPTIKKMVTSG